MRWLLGVVVALISIAVIIETDGYTYQRRLLSSKPIHGRRRAAKRSSVSTTSANNQRRNAIVIKMQIQEKKPKDSKESKEQQRPAIKQAGPGVPKADENQIRDIPYQVAIGKRLGAEGKLELACGGALVAKDWVLTAAHCVDGINAESFDIVVGKSALDKKSPNEQWFTVKQIVLHKSYQKGADHDDIALVRLDNAATMNNGVKLILLPETENMDSSGSGLITGWGAQRWKGPTSPLLKKFSVPILTPSQCEKLRGGQTTQSHAEICAQAGEGPDAMEACGTGDSGGPLVCYDEPSGSTAKNNGKSNSSTSSSTAGTKSKTSPTKPTTKPLAYNKRDASEEFFKPKPKDPRRYYVCGVVSHSTKCYKLGDPAVFTKVSHYLDWIQKTIQSGVRISKEIHPDKGKLLLDYPFLAVVNRVPVDGPKEHRARCMGTMLNEIFILTSADCLVPTSDHVCYYWVGFGNTTHGDEACVRLPVADFFLFDPTRFLLQMADPKKRDRGLTDSPNENRNKPVVLQLARSISTNERAFPVHLPTANNFIGLAAKVISFSNITADTSGPGSRNAKNNKDADKVIAGDFMIVDRDPHCPESLLQQHNLNRSTSVCAKRLSGPPCSEYLPGSPLVCQSKLPSGSAVIGGERFLCGIMAKPRTNSKSSMDRNAYTVVRQETGNGKKNTHKKAADGPDYCIFRKLWVNEQKDS